MIAIGAKCYRQINDDWVWALQKDNNNWIKLGYYNDNIGHSVAGYGCCRPNRSGWIWVGTVVADSRAVDRNGSD